jgi:RNA polymerase sigma factor (sigma-70 family)
MCQPRSSPADDDDLLRQAADGRDAAAFALLVRRYGPLVRSACRRVLGVGPDAEDAAQATFVLLWRDACRIRSGRAVGGWLLAVARRTAVRARAAAARRLLCERRAAEHAARAAPPPDLDRLEACAVLREELGRLPAGDLGPLLLCCLEGRPRDEAARALGCSPGALKGRLERARERLRRRLARRGVGA